MNALQFPEFLEKAALDCIGADQAGKLLTNFLLKQWRRSKRDELRRHVVVEDAFEADFDDDEDPEEFHDEEPQGLAGLREFFTRPREKEISKKDALVERVAGLLISDRSELWDDED